MPRSVITGLRRNRIDPVLTMKILPILVILLGLGLRLFELGNDCFWFDEVGVARVAQSTSLAGVLAGARQHVLAMPLDYVVAWLVSHISTEEWALRLASAIWGTLAIGAAYLLFRKLAGGKAALIGALCLALAPLHIQYSQELRFYAPLTFFSLFSTWLLLRAIEHPSVLRWVAFTLVAVVGLFFHIYVLLILVTGFLWVAFGPEPGGGRRKTLLAFFASGAVLSMLFLIGWFFLTGQKTYSFALDYSESSLWSALATGLGWLPPFIDAHLVGIVLGFLYLCLSSLGAVITLKKCPRSYLSLILIGALIQLVLILLADLASGYFFKGRQALQILPVTFLFVAIGVCAIAQSVQEKLARAGQASSAQGILAVLGGIILLLNIPSISAYYQWDKNDSCRISQALIENYTPGTSIVVLPKWEYLDYTYYVGKSPTSEEIVPSIQGIEWNELASLEAISGPIYLVAEPAPDTGQSQLLEDLSFTPYPSTEWEGKLWYRPGL